MTVPLTGFRQTFAGSGSSGPFPVTAYGIFAATDVQVTLKTDATGAFVSKVLTTDYTVTLTDPANLPSTFTINWVSTNPAVGETVIADLFIPFTQLLDFLRRGKFPAESNEEGLDRAMTGLAQLAGPLGLSAYNVEQTDFLALDSTSLDKWGGEGRIGANFLAGVAGTDLAIIDQITIAALADVPLANGTIYTGNASNNPVSTALGDGIEKSGSSVQLDLQALGGLEINSNEVRCTELLRDISGLTVVEGDILHVDSSLDIVKLAVGTANQLLIGGSVPSYASVLPKLAVPAGNRVLLQTQTASNDSSIDFTSNIDSTYDIYELEIDDFTPVSDSKAQLKVSSNGGSSFLGGTDYNSNMHYGTAGSTSTNFSEGGTAQANFVLTNTIGATANSNQFMLIRFFNPDATTFFTLHWLSVWRNSAGNTTRGEGGGHYEIAATVIDAIQIVMNTGNISKGTFKLYGIKK